MEFNKDRYLKPQAPKKGIHSPLHEFVEETRREWNDQVSFGRWLTVCKGVPLSRLFMIRGNVRDSPKAKTPAKLFFWLVKKWKDDQKQALSTDSQLITKA